MCKTALVTGAGSGIGRGIALALARAGYDTAVHYCGSLSGAEETKRQIEAMGRKSAIYHADLNHVDEIQKMFSDFEEDFGNLDAFVNNAGITLKSPFLETDEETFDKVCNVDFRGAFFAMQRAARLMVRRGTHGSMVLIASNNAYAHFADVSVYGSVKAAAVKMAEHIAIELACRHIRVNTVAPGWTDTGAARLDAKEETYYKIPLKKWATVEEVAQSVVWLCSDAAASVTGATLVMDNGALLLSDTGSRYGL